MSSKIVVVGSCMVDFVSYTKSLPKEGETIHGSKFVTNFGGKGANQCVAAAKLGGNTTFVARLGDDVWGQKYIEHLQEENVSTKFVKNVPNSSSGVAQIIVSEAGANQIVIVAGANNDLTLEHVEEATEEIISAEVLVVQLETSVEVAIKALFLCRGVSILNGAPALSSFPQELLTLPTIFCVNESEAEVFTGLTVESKKDATKAAKSLIKKGCKNVLITLGKQGAIFVRSSSPEQVFCVESPEVKCVDSTGAGDSFIGALALLLSKNVVIEKAIQAACIIAADSVTRPGTQISFPGAEILKEPRVSRIICD